MWLSSESPLELGAGFLMARVASGLAGGFHLSWGWSSGSCYGLWSIRGSSTGGRSLYMVMGSVEATGGRLGRH